MRFLFAFGVALAGWWGLSSSAVGNVGSCQSALATSDTSNTGRLWEGASVCAKEGDIDTATLLLLLGQIRLTTDFSLLEAMTEQDEDAQGEWYGMLYYKMGGSGSDEIYRSPARTASLFAKISAWAPELQPDYDPGWSYRPLHDTGVYRQFLRCQKLIRLQKLSWYASLIRDDDYYETYVRLNELRQRNPGAIEMGSAIEKEMRPLQERLTEISARYPSPRTQPAACDFPIEHGPKPDADFEQLFVGANGRSSTLVERLYSREQAEESWLSESIGSGLTDILDQVDFSSQMLVVFSFGEMRSATGNAYLSDIKYRSSRQSFGVDVRIGVQSKGCEYPSQTAFPFIVAMAPTIPVDTPSSSYSRQNFSDGCKPSMRGEPAVEDK